MLRRLRTFSILFFLLTLISCGSSGGDAPSRRPSATVDGFAVDAQITGGSVTVYSYINAQKGSVLGSAVTDDTGFYSITLQGPDQPILIEVRGGSYIEEASGAGITLNDGQILRAVTFYKSGFPVRLMVTPFTNITAGLIEYQTKSGTPVEIAITDATSAISAMAGVDILTTVPLNITDLKNARMSLTAGLKYGFLAAAISSWTAEASVLNGANVHLIWNSISLSQVMYRDISEDGLLDGKGINPNSGTIVDLGFGLVPLDANTYRVEFARHLMKMAGSEENKTGIGFSEVLLEADRLAGMTHQIFNGLPTVPLDTTGPVIDPIEAEGLFHNDSLTFAVDVSDTVGIKSVFFDLDGVAIGQAIDPQNPAVLINTNLYTDGGHTIGVRATDNLENETYRQFAIKFANSGAVVNVLSSTTVNSSPVILSGDYIDNGVGIQSITVQGLPADINAVDKTWNVSIPLVPPNPTQSAAFVKTVPIVIKDNLDIENTKLVTVTMDTIKPAIDPFYSVATFVVGTDTFTESLSFAATSGIPLRIETDKISLNGVPILEGALGINFIPYIVIHVNDPNVNAVFTPENEITADIQYKLKGSIVAPWHSLVPVDTANNYRFIIPLVSELLHPDWQLATPQDQHEIEIRIKDRAGNATDLRFPFQAEFVPPPPVVTSTAINAFNKPFPNRAELYGKVLSVSEHLISNNTNFPILFSLSDPAIHTVVKVAEEAVRKLEGNKITQEDWRIQYRYWLIKMFDVPIQVMEDPNATWQSTTSVDLKNKDPNTGAITQTTVSPNLPATGPTISFPTEQLPLSTSTLWESFHPPLADTTGMNYFGPIPSGDPRILATFAYFPSAGNFLQRRTVTSYQWATGSPRNEYLLFSETNNFLTDHFEVRNNVGERKLSINGFYRIPPKTTYTINKYVLTPQLTFYNDTEVGNRETFVSATPKKYDLSIAWTINNQIDIKIVHDTGFEKALEMVAVDVVRGGTPATYTITR